MEIGTHQQTDSPDLWWWRRLEQAIMSMGGSLFVFPESVPCAQAETEIYTTTIVALKSFLWIR